jgi:drug/metabolite transporter (DMT)-like permease
VLPDLSVSVWAYLAAYAIAWLALATVTWQWSVSRMEAGRSGVLGIAELAMALLSATLIGGAMLDAGEWAGAALIAGAALLVALEPDSQDQNASG